MIDPLFSMALLTGFVGSGHCLGMCGGLVAALSLTPDGRRGGLPFHLFYNAGRTFTYTLIGLAVGWLGSTLALTGDFRAAARMLLLGSDLFVILLGLGTAGAFTWLNFMRLEFPGPVQAMTRAVGGLRKLPPSLAAFPLGLMMGFLPCGFLYAMVLTAAQSTSPLSGAGIMFAFGLGTIPALFLFGSAAHLLSSRARSWMLRSAGVLVALMGAYNLVRHLNMMKMM
ncbi:MAG: sulfite exporter TauE/SafE family protein [Desulfuromonadales bacterium]|nr:sulfite exporter TauE/SafE family protein [Desulfuromonadales bacterium]NIR34451.1 sulfite exporter TauE/SafE family protein [Desulfuromonadales bacterium]NIS42988.1 sulfite exporter TauE/SafE family protein [Desulfuromonadales bacterium]